MTGKRIVIAGAGSHFTPGLLTDLVSAEGLRGSTVVLLDPWPEGVSVMAGLARRLVAEREAELRVEQTVSRREALEGADFVISTIRVGGLKAHSLDIAIPLRHGVYQSVGDTVGPGGIFAGLRHIPATLEICRDMEDLCPGAWLINFTNPMSAVCMAVTRETGVRTVGLCHGIYGTKRFLAGYLGAPPEQLTATAGGINHLTWIVDLRLNGFDAYPILRETLAKKGPGGQPISFLLCKLYGLYPSPGDRHVAEFFPWFLTKESGGGSAYGLELRDIGALEKEREESWRRLSAQASGQAPLTPRPSGEVAIPIIDSIANHKPGVYVVNIRGNGCIPSLPADAVVEVPAHVDAGGVHGLNVSLPRSVSAILTRHVHEQEMVAEAGAKGDRELVLQALLIDPLIRGVEQAQSMMEEMIAADAEHLAQFR